MVEASQFLERPIPLSPDNFTPIQRTPWAGTQLSENIKKRHSTNRQKIGESWEVSCDPDFPSLIQGTDYKLSELIEGHREKMLSPQCVTSGANYLEILVKLINAASPLSVQVHPHDQDINLKPHECGKPESWLVLDAQENSGIYLGFSEKITKEELRLLLTANSPRLKELLQFVPVKRGDYFNIDPGVPHAIGPGVVLLEPQRVLYGKSGKTYRLWDWGRRYNLQGQLDPKGTARDLHIEEALGIIDPEHQWGENFIKNLKQQATRNALKNGAQISHYPGNSHYKTTTLSIPKGAQTKYQIKAGFSALILIEGEVEISGKSKTWHQHSKGETLYLPYSGSDYYLKPLSNCFFANIEPQIALSYWLPF